MGAADDFMNSFFAAYPHARNGNLSMEELNSLIGEYQRKVNNDPVDDFDGLSSQQMSSLLYGPLAPGSILQFREDMDAQVNSVPFFKLSEILLHEIKQAGGLKLTVNGNLPIRICELLCNQNLIYWPYMHLFKRIREEEVPYLWPLKQYILDLGIVKKRNNTLSLTKNGEKLLMGPQHVRFAQIFNYVTSRFHWCNFYDIQDEGKCGQFGWAYSLVLLSKYGNKPQKSEFYSLKVIQAFEEDLWDAERSGTADQSMKDYHRAYQVRFFECFADWFGLINIERTRDYSVSYFDQLNITKSELFDQLFEIKKEE